MGSLVGATLTVLLALFTLCGAIPLGPCTSTGAQAVVNASGLCAVPVAPALSPVCGAQACLINGEPIPLVIVEFLESEIPG